ncbi:hypothetical protein [Micromonospora sp. NPDC049204]|uniref:3-hydroxyacyl-ACP dehydratase FabZ family protein n=1 Tax=unclassified Micromonospora TaxID=2617518 RepID=UPI003400F746
MSAGIRSALSIPVHAHSGADGVIIARTVAEADLPLLRGHYPGFPVFPAVFLIECAHRAITAVAGPRRLAGVERSRFHSPVLPGDEVRFRIEQTDPAGAFRCVAETDRGTAAEIRLRYQTDREGDRR